MREEKGKIISKKQDQITRIDETHYTVKSQSRDIEHDVIALESGWSCSCEDHYFKKILIKRVYQKHLSILLVDIQ